MKLSVFSSLVRQFIAESRRAGAGLKTVGLSEGYPRPGQF